MSVSTTVPVRVTPEATARLAELDLQPALEQMLEYVRALVPDLLRLEVILEPAYDTGDDPYLTIQAFAERSVRQVEAGRTAWSAWKVATFPPEVCRHITLMILTTSEGASRLTLREFLCGADQPVPVAIEAGVEERLAELGMHEEVFRIVRQVRDMVAGLSRFRIEMNERMDGSDPGISLVAVHAASAERGDRYHDPLVRWYRTTFPSEVRENVSLELQPE